MRTKIGHSVYFLRWMILGVFVWFAASTTRADSPKILQIEEQWELHLGNPDAELSAPQATMVMSPHEDLDGLYFLFTLNHHSVPDYEPGGVQVQLWDGNAAVDSASDSATGPLSQENDVVRWTQRLTIDNGSMTFEVVDGSSDSWGNFGNDGTLKLTTSTTLDCLNDYRPATSLNESKVGYAGNRVFSLVLKKLVWRMEDGQTHEMNAPIDIDADLDP